MIAPLVGWLVSILTERCAFGTDSSRAAYEQMLGPRIITSKTFPDLHAQRTTSAVPPDAPAVLFVGALEPRKGLAELMSAWEVVEQRLPNSELTIIGDGVMAKAVEAWVAAGEKRNWLGVQSRTAIYAAMQRSVALVVPSIRFGRWKEQVSRPIQEALSHGLTIVSSDETGIGSFLDTHGHYVIPVRDIGVRLADAIEQALRSPLPRQEVLDSLPMEDGRLAADRWLHSRSPSVCEPD
jgi:glycosyltransferase involved in cell wall biosynthesis